MQVYGRYGLLIVVTLLVVLFGVLSPVFLSGTNLLNILDQVTITGVISFGMTLVILIGGIDLSVGSIVAFTGIILAQSLLGGLPLFVSVLLCFVAGAGLGAINGFFIAYSRVPAFITTLGLMSIARGAALYLTDGRALSGLPDGLSVMVNHLTLGVPVSVCLLLFLYLLFWLFLKYTYWGKFLYAIGGSERAAWLSGIKVRPYKLLVYSISGLVSAVSAILLVGKLNSAQPQAGNLYELNTIAAVVIGGASLAGGKGEIRNTFLGVLILGILQNGLSLLNVSSYYQQILVGMIVIFAVLADSKSLNKRKYEK
jgi:ribose/xylose/arabinose/galactoside ABC-type transport system permease subunit